ncbi:hypothetical protein UYSO10_2190 [Kosakonia radicincitans]|uniref:hypothetical protein n=1 Tax=Kosakonia radicincitans TaxID=283686 RepID=UPI001182AB16|nr:hypothetical protein [Kosakonia radicincitans]VVT48259.1 hypothetical protein UYSO10_2190 [Kosakonia radicincitans]
MLIEQAFHNLPEILLGSGYSRQEYARGFEASIVSAFSLAILQELNGRNAPNPISFLMAEKRYSELRRNIRADLHVNLSKLFTGSEDYAKFGFRFSNWIEAKYFRKTKGSIPYTQNRGLVVADLIRLIGLIPREEKDGLTRTGRYFLHVYQGNPLSYLHSSVKTAPPERKWVDQILRHGYQSISDLELGTEKKSFFTHFPKSLANAAISLDVTNYKLNQLQDQDNSSYTLILTRIESAKMLWNNKVLTLTGDRKLECDEFENFRDVLSEKLKPQKD